ncbi:MAG: ABC transporter ATP-binding protein [bacterium]
MKSEDQYAIVAQNLQKFYGHIKALDGVSFEIKRNQVTSLLGPNGAGKTTLVKILTTIAEPSNGKAWVEGYDIQKDSINVRRMVGVVPQINNLDSYLTARENLILHAKMHSMPRKIYSERIDELFQFMGIYERRNDYPDTYSGGMQRRLIFARALIHNPQILFLDEPTTGLDPQTRRAVWEHIEKIKNTITIFLTTHYMEEADILSDRVMIIDHGKIIADGSSGELKRAVPGMRAPSLEDVFIHLTGRRIRE